MKKITFKNFLLAFVFLTASFLQAQVANEIQLDPLGGGSEGNALYTDEMIITISTDGLVSTPGLGTDDWAAIGTTGTVSLAGALNKTVTIYTKGISAVNTTDDENLGDITTEGGTDRAGAGDLGIRQGSANGIENGEGFIFGFDASNLATSVAIQITAISVSSFSAVGEEVTFVNRLDTSKKLIVTSVGGASNGFQDLSALDLYVRGGINLGNVVSAYASNASTILRINGIKFKIVDSSTLPSIWVGRTTDYGDTQNWLNNATPISSSNVTIQNYANQPVIFGSRDYAANNLNIAKGTDIELRDGASLIVNGTSTGNISFRRTITKSAVATEAWYLMASPAVGETFNDAFVTANDIAISGTGNRGVATYNSGDNTWAYLGSGGTINSTSGKGYSIKKDNAAANNFVYFNGTINTDNTGVTPTGLSAGFNLLGNPYTSYVNSGTFLGDNTNLDAQIWLWNQSTGMYEVKTSGESFMLTPAQGFFVKVNTGTSVNFAESNQASGADTFQKSARTDLKLLMNDGTSNRFAKIYFTETATKGFDNGWEGEVFGGIANKLDVFTELVNDNQGKNYQLQSLPLADLESTIIPVGVIAEAGKELTFSLEQANFPADVKVYLEDKVSNTFNEISNNQTYKVTLNEALNDVGRFYLHTSSSALSVDDNLSLTSVSIYKTNATTLKLVGLPNGTSTIKLFNILGKQVVTTSFTANGVKEISLPNLSTGVYVVQLTTETSKVSKKIILE